MTEWQIGNNKFVLNYNSRKKYNTIDFCLIDSNNQIKFIENL
jgi:hypothetical protein